MTKGIATTIDPMSYKSLIGVASAHPNALHRSKDLVSKYLFYDKMLVVDLDHAIASHEPDQMFAKPQLGEMLREGKDLGVFEDSTSLSVPFSSNSLSWQQMLEGALDGSLIKNDPILASAIIQNLTGRLYQTEYNKLATRFGREKMDLGVDDLADDGQPEFARIILLGLGVALDYPDTKDARTHAEGTNQIWPLHVAHFRTAQEFQLRRTLHLARADGMIAEDASGQSIIEKGTAVLPSNEYSVASILLDQIPMPNDLSLQELVEFKSNGKVKQSIRSFRSLVAGITQADLKEAEAKELFADARAELAQHIRKARRGIVFHTVRISVVCTAGVVQDLLTGKFVEAADRVISASEDLINLYPTDKMYVGHPLFFAQKLSNKQ